MSLSGSLIFLFYLLVKPLSSYCFNARWQYRLLKIAMIFYLLPYQYIKNMNYVILNKMFGNEEHSNPVYSGIATYDINKILYTLDDGSTHFKYKNIILGFILAWFIVVFIMIVRQVFNYFKCKRKLIMISEPADNEIENILEKCLHDKAVHNRKIRLLVNANVSSPFTMGIFSPIIIIPKSCNNPFIIKMYLIHEVNHINNKDVLFKFFSFFIILLHWYNPLVYLMFSELCSISEKTSDEKVVSQIEENEIIDYGMLIIESAKQPTNISVLFADTFSRNSTMAKGRIMFMTRKHKNLKYRKAITLLIGLFILMFTPISVMAYQPSITILSHDLDESAQDTTMMVFVPEDHDTDLFFNDPTISLDFNSVDEYFIDSEGNVYEIHPNEHRIVCNHVYVNGQLQKHSSVGNGCKVYIYNAQLCKICGTTIQGTLINTISYTTCIH